MELVSSDCRCRRHHHRSNNNCSVADDDEDNEEDKDEDRDAFDAMQGIEMEHLVGSKGHSNNYF